MFPSLTDTFGLVVLEAMSSGTPVAAYDATGPRDVIPGSNAGTITPVDGDLAAGAIAWRDLNRETCRKYAEGYSWRACAEAFIENLQPLPAPARKRFWQKIRLRRRKKPLELVIPPLLDLSPKPKEAPETSEEPDDKP